MNAVASIQQYDASRDPDFIETEKRLVSWGSWACHAAEKLGYPQSTSIARLIEQVKVFDRQRGEAKRGKETARGKETVSFRPPAIGPVPGEIMSVDAAIAKLPKWAETTIWRSYRYGQPDRRACQDLRMPKAAYRAQRESAVLQVAEILAIRTSAKVRF